MNNISEQKNRMRDLILPELLEEGRELAQELLAKTETGRRDSEVDPVLSNLKDEKPENKPDYGPVGFGADTLAMQRLRKSRSESRAVLADDERHEQKHNKLMELLKIKHPTGKVERPKLEPVQVQTTVMPEIQIATQGIEVEPSAASENLGKMVDLTDQLRGDTVTAENDLAAKSADLSPSSPIEDQPIEAKERVTQMAESVERAQSGSEDSVGIESMKVKRPIWDIFKRLPKGDAGTNQFAAIEQAAQGRSENPNENSGLAA